MATLGNIRKHGVALIVIVGLAMVAFIVGDFLSSSNTYFNRRKEYVGEIEGQQIHYLDYEAAKEQLTEVYKIETGRNDLDEDMTANLRNQVWQMLVSEHTLNAQAEKIGMDVTAEELADICFGKHIHQIIRSRRVFFDQNGQFSPAILANFIAQMDQMDEENPDRAAYMEQFKSYWLYWEKAVRLTRMQEKYTDLLTKCVTANSLDAEFAFNAGLTSTTVEYVMKPYFAIADSAVIVKDSEIKALYNKKKENYKQQPNRSIAYVSFPIVPSEYDFEQAKAALEKLQQEFYTTEDVMTIVNVNSDITYNGMNLSEAQVPEEYKEFCFGKQAKTGDVTEITFDAATNTYAMARLVEAGYNMPDSVEIKAVATEEGQEDQVLGWFTEVALGKDVAAKAFACKKGESFTIGTGAQEQKFVVTDLSKATPKVKLAILARNVIASSRTHGEIFNQAKQFIVANSTEEKFQEAAEEAHMTLHPAIGLLATTDKVDNLKSSRAIVRWAFEAKEGAVSDVFECGDQFVVAVLTATRDGEYRPMADVQGELRYELLNEKKAAKVADDLKGVTSIEEAAQKLGADVQVAEDVTLASYRFGAAGAEPAVLGAALRLAPGELSAPIKGIAGVYVVKGAEKTTVDATFNKEAQMQQLNMRTAYSLPYQAMNLLEEKAEITDNRPKFQ